MIKQIVDNGIDKSVLKTLSKNKLKHEKWYFRELVNLYKYRLFES